jgi:predicted enzyme related to lactoylglutathione lyase
MKRSYRDRHEYDNVEITMHPQRNSFWIDPIATGKIVPEKTSPDRARCFFPQCLLAALLGIAVTSPLMSATLQLPALVTPSSHEHHVGKVIFVELVTPDIAAAKQFYAELFGWNFRDIDAGKAQYAEAFLDGHSVAGLLQKAMPAGEQRRPAWLGFLAVRDVDSAKATAEQHGAKVLFAPHNFPNRGREAVFADPQGAVFAVLASSSGDPPDELAAPGEWIWSSLITSDPDTDAAFYQTLFDYEVFDSSDDDGAQHLMLATENYARASANSLPANKPGVHPHWLNFVRVDDASAAAAKAVTLGGRILVEPRVDRHGGRLAVVADPQGAPFGLLEWPDTESKEVTP